MPLILLFGGRRTDPWGHWLGCAAALAAFGVGASLLADMLSRDSADRTIHQTLFTWVPVNQLQVDFGLQIDQLSMCFVLLISGVGSLIHIYSVAYMAEDTDRRRFFGYLNLFLASMLLLVVADNYLVLYVGWEGVGLASYLLIGFWYHKPSAATAAKKAFVMNRVGDAGPCRGHVRHVQQLRHPLVRRGVRRGTGRQQGALTAMGLLLLMGACAKSAQVPLQAWLGDAMEGPTPVSALIHAATMVTAGVYLIVRSNPIYNLSPDARLGVVIVGTVTLLFGAFIGCAKDDIKRALAASTMSQIGYMVLAAGLGPAGYAFAIMHLLDPRLLQGRAVPRRRARSSTRCTKSRTCAGTAACAPPCRSRSSRSDWAIWPSSAYRRSPASSPRTRSSRRRLAPSGAQGYVLGGARAARRGHHRVLHDPGDADDLLRREALGPRRASARIAATDDLADDPARRRLGVRRRPVRRQRHAAALARARRRRSLGNRGMLAPKLGQHHAGAGASSRSVSQWPTGCTAARPGEIPQSRPGPSLGASRRPHVPTSTAMPSTRRCSCAPARELTRALVEVDNAAVDGSVNALAALVSRTSNRLREMQTGFARNYALSMLVGATLVAAAILAVKLW